MRIYHYHPVTKEYLGEGVADPNPLEPGKYLIPANSTTIAPPIVPNGYAAVFAGGKWELVVDNRGKVLWNKATKEKYVITRLGEEVSDDYTELEPGEGDMWDGTKWVKDPVYYTNLVRQKRNELLKEVDELTTRHLEQRELVAAGLIEETTLTEEQFKELLLYKQQLRDLMETVDVFNPVFPEKPSFINEGTAN